MKLKISDIRTNLFTQVTICDFGECEGVKIIQFDEHEWKKDGRPRFMSLYQIVIIIRPQGIAMHYRGVIHLTPEQLDEIHRISTMLREVK